jgi:diguanylate cyclase (GGDEF)-like protein
MQPKPAEWEQEEFQRSLIAAINEASPDGILVVDGNHRIVSHNKRLLATLEIDPAQAPGTRDGSLVGLPDEVLMAQALSTVKHPTAFVVEMKSLFTDPRAEDHSELELRSGRTLERHSMSLWNQDGRYLGRVWFFHDISERKAIERRLLEMSHTDELTGIANRRHFFERATEEFSRARRFGRELAFIMLDLDHFKNVNDRWGHASGDRVLKAFTDCVLSTIREMDLVARLGGEEFVIMAPDTNEDSAHQLAERVRQRFEKSHLMEGSEQVRLTVCAGVSTVRPEEGSPDAALKRADEALYEAKRTGRNRTVLDSGKSTGC